MIAAFDHEPPYREGWEVLRVVTAVYMDGTELKVVYKYIYVQYPNA